MFDRAEVEGATESSSSRIKTTTGAFASAAEQATLRGGFLVGGDKEIYNRKYEVYSKRVQR
jgi:hypothetical protein